MVDHIKQTGVYVNDGSLVGRDQHNTTYQIVGLASPMTKLSIAFMEEMKNNEMINSVLPELEHYMSNVDIGDVIGLEEKLRLANRNSEITEATRQKEIVAKRLHRHSTSRSVLRN